MLIYILGQFLHTIYKIVTQAKLDLYFSSLNFESFSNPSDSMAHCLQIVVVLFYNLHVVKLYTKKCANFSFLGKTFVNFICNHL